MPVITLVAADPEPPTVAVAGREPLQVIKRKWERFQFWRRRKTTRLLKLRSEMSGSVLTISPEQSKVLVQVASVLKEDPALQQRWEAAMKQEFTNADLSDAGIMEGFVTRAQQCLNDLISGTGSEDTLPREGKTECELPPKEELREEAPAEANSVDPVRESKKKWKKRLEKWTDNLLACALSAGVAGAVVMLLGAIISVFAPPPGVIIFFIGVGIVAAGYAILPAALTTFLISETIVSISSEVPEIPETPESPPQAEAIEQLAPSVSTDPEPEP